LLQSIFVLGNSFISTVPVAVTLLGGFALETLLFLLAFKFFFTTGSFSSTK
jgi:hypothetical protein